MNNQDIATRRLYNQRLTGRPFKKPTEVVQWLGAVQAQDFAAAKWALGLRLSDATDAAVEQAFTAGAILRTHILRPTWHFVTPADIRWMLALTAPRVDAANAYMYRRLGLDEAVFKKSRAALVKALQGGRQLTRAELSTALERAGIEAGDSMRLGYLIHRAELEGIVCSGPRRGRQFTYALLEERVPPVKALKRDQALAALTSRYFASRGPATAQDFAWWSGLTLADARRGIELVAPEVAQEVIQGQTYWSAASAPSPRAASSSAHLLPNYDEYFIGFKDRSAISGSVKMSDLDERSAGLTAHILVVDGRIVGGWRRTLKKDVVLVELNLLVKLTKDQFRLVAAAAERYGAFLGLPLELT